MDSPPALFTVSAHIWYPRWAICPPVASSPDSSSTAPTLNVSDAAPPPPLLPPHAARKLGPATAPPTTRPVRVRKRRRLMWLDMVTPLELPLRAADRSDAWFQRPPKKRFLSSPSSSTSAGVP